MSTTTTIPPHVLHLSPRSERIWRATLLVLASLVVLVLLGALGAQSAISWWTQRSFTDIPAQVELAGATSVDVHTDLGDVEVVTGDVDSPTLGLVDPGSEQLPGSDATARARITVEGTPASPIVTVAQPAGSGPIPWEDDRKEVLLVLPVSGITALDVSTGVGDVEVTGVGGRIDAGTGTGDVSIQAVPAGASVTAGTSVGNIDVQLEGTSAESAVDLSTDVGDVAVLVPPEGAWLVDAASDAGDVFIAPGIEAAGASGASIRIRASVGDVTVTR